MVVATDPTHPDRIECSTVPPESIDKKMSWMQRRDYMATVNPMGNCVYVCSHHSNGHLATSKMNDGMKSYDTGAILTQNACDLYGRENCTGIRTVRNIIVVMWTRVIDPIPRGQSCSGTGPYVATSKCGIRAHARLAQGFRNVQER